MLKYLYIFFLFFSVCLAAQEPNRFTKLEKDLEILSATYPEFQEKVEVNLTNTNLSNFLIAISKVHDININISNQLEATPIINNFSNVSIKDLFLFLAKEYDLEFDIIGNIVSVEQYEPPKLIPQKKELQISFEPANSSISMDLRQDLLGDVFRKLTDVSGKNIVFAPGMEEIPLTAYLNSVPFDSAMDKLAISNNLKVEKSRDGFFIFNPNGNYSEGNAVFKPIALSQSFYYKIQDSINKIIEVEFMEAPAEKVIYSISEDLGLDIFIASDLSEMGTISIKAKSIHYETLLNKIFASLNEGSLAGNRPEPNNSVNNRTNGNNMGLVNNSIEQKNYTFKKEGQIYYFGTEDQLALKSVEIISMLHRSIELLTNPSGRDYNRQNRRNTMFTGTSNYYGVNNTSSNSQGFNNNQQYRATNNNSEESTKQSITEIIPEDILEGLEVKIDSELNSFIVSGPAARIERFKEFVRYIDKPVPVILIEVMILEVNKSALVETGVSFGLGEEPVTTQGEAFPSANMRLGASTVNRIIGGFDAFGTLNIGKVLPNFYMDIKAMESNGSLRILSTPKLSTLNGHKAHLSSGQTTYYAVTNQNFFGSQIPQTSEITNYYPIDAELAIEIMPFVSGDGEITMDINVVQSSFNGERIAEEAPPGMNSREFSSLIRMRDQDVAILGGIDQRTKDDSGSGVPLLARVPVLKWLFSNRRREDSNKKLNILIKPTVIY